MAIGFNGLAQRYLNELQAAIRTAAASGEATRELSFRPPLHEFFKAITNQINSKIEIIYEPRTQATAGRPDWRFHNADTLGVYGYCEGKGIDLTNKIDLRLHRSQLKRYSALRQAVMVTDGLEFVLLDGSGCETQRLSLVKKPVRVDQLHLGTVELRLENAFKLFFQDAAARVCDEEQLVEECALRAARLAESVRELAALPLGSGLTASENRTIKALRELQDSLASHQDANLRTPSAFADFVAQVLIFGLIYAHRCVAKPTDSPKTRYKKIHAFWADVVYQEHSKNLRPFRALVWELGDELKKTALGPLGAWYDDCRLMLAHVELSSKQTAAPDYHTLFERFLSVYDPTTRFSYGAFYTPQPVARFAARLSCAVASIRGKVPGLFTAGHKLIDPCCGTGSFIEQLLSFAGRGPCAASITALEILPGPYALAHYRLRMLGHAAYPKNVKILLTDTLADQLNSPNGRKGSQSDFAKEQEDARQSSQRPLTLVIGNPPSVDPGHQKERSVDNQRQVLALIDDWRPPENERTSRQNTQKQLNNEFIKFFRWACDRLPANELGIVCLVVPSSFAGKPSYRYARKWLLDFFREVWVLSIDSDCRRGVGNSSLFSTLQGRMLFVGLRDCNKHAGQAVAWYSSIESLDKTAKLHFLGTDLKLERYLDLFERILPETPRWSLRPAVGIDEARYKSFWPLCDNVTTEAGSASAVFARSCSGVKLAPTALFTHIDKKVLRRKLAYIADLNQSFESITDKWFAGQQKAPKKGKLSTAIRKAIGAALIACDAIQRYSYRPFVSNYVLCDPAVLRHLASGDTGGGGGRFRPEIGAAFEDRRTFGISVTPAPEDVGDDMHRFVSFCWNLPDNDLAKRGNGRVCCNRFPLYKKKRDSWDKSLKCNIHPDLRKHFAKCLGCGEYKAADAVVFYCYAVLCSNVYMHAFEGRLRGGLHDQWPRIPIAAKKDVVRILAEQGERLARLENCDEPVSLRRPFEDLLKGFSGSFFLDRFSVDEVEGVIELFGEGDAESPRVTIPGISEGVLETRVSGYSPFQQWLKVHTRVFSRREFTSEDLHELCGLIERVAEQLDILVEVDATVSRIISDPKAIFVCTGTA